MSNGKKPTEPPPSKEPSTGTGTATGTGAGAGKGAGAGTGTGTGVTPQGSHKPPQNVAAGVGGLTGK
jgi:hypothetical protein